MNDAATNATTDDGPRPPAAPSTAALAVAALLVLGCKPDHHDDPGPEDPPLVTIDDDAPTNASSCEERLGFAKSTIAAAAEAANGTCNSDGDCTLVFTDTECLGACQAAVLATRRSDFEAAKALINKRACTDYALDGCPYATPTCLAMEAKCQDERCVMVERAG